MMINLTVDSDEEWEKINPEKYAKYVKKRTVNDLLYNFFELFENVESKSYLINIVKSFVIYGTEPSYDVHGLMYVNDDIDREINLLNKNTIRIVMYYDDYVEDYYTDYSDMNIKNLNKIINDFIQDLKDGDYNIDSKFFTTYDMDISEYEKFKTFLYYILNYLTEDDFYLEDIHTFPETFKVYSKIKNIKKFKI